MKENDKIEIHKCTDFEVDGNSQKDIWSKAETIILKDSVTGKEIEGDQAKVKMAWSANGFYILYEARDKHIWGTYKNDDDPLYDEEVVEIFITGGLETPKKYFEFQFSPNGVKFDAKISNPTGDRSDAGFNVDVSWNCAGLKLAQTFDPPRHSGLDPESIPFAGTWWTEVFIPWESVEVKNAAIGTVLRANLFRIDGYLEQTSFQSWQPTLKDPPNFHVPEKFGYIELKG